MALTNWTNSLTTSLATSLLASLPTVTHIDDNASSLNHTTMSPAHTSASPSLHQHSIFVSIVMAFGFFCVIFFSVSGNILVIFAVYKNLRLRSKTNYFIVSLAFADLLVAILAMTFNASALLTSPETTWKPLGPILCKFWLASDILCSTSSCLHLCAIAVDRYTAILHPYRYQDIMNKRRVVGIIFVIWVVSATLSFGPIFTDVYTTQESMIPLDKDIVECELKTNQIFAIVSSCITFWIPAITMSAIYIRVFIEANRQEQAIVAERRRIHSQLQQSSSFRGNNINDSMMTNHDRDRDASCPPTPDVNRRERHGTGTDSFHGTGTDSVRSTTIERKNPESRKERMLKRERKAAKTLAIIMGAFLVCWLPFMTWYIIDFVIFNGKMIDDNHTWIIDLLFWIGYLNSALNPIIYAYFNRDFRLAFKKLLYCDHCEKVLVRCKQSRRSKRNNGFVSHNPLHPLPDTSSN